jgi:hypothetical protein
VIGIARSASRSQNTVDCFMSAPSFDRRRVHVALRVYRQSVPVDSKRGKRM